MIRLPPSAITLGPGDLFDSEIRQRRNSTKGNNTAQLLPTAETPSKLLKQEDVGKWPKAESCSFFKGQHLEDGSFTSRNKERDLQDSIRHPDTTNLGLEDVSLVDGTLSFNYHHMVGDTESETIEIQQRSPYQNDFHFGGFIKGPTPSIVDDNFGRSSPFGKSV